MSVSGSALQQSLFPPEPARKFEVRLNWELPKWLPSFLDNLSSAFQKAGIELPSKTRPGIFWKDVFVDQRLNWRSIARSYAGHLAFAGLVYLISLPFYADKIETIENFHHDRLIYLNPDQDILASELPKKAESAPQVSRIVSRSSRAQDASRPDARKRVAEAMAIPKWADNTSRVIVAPQAPKVLASASIPDIVLSSPVPQAPPVAAASSPKLVVPVIDIAPIAPPPDVTQARLNTPQLPQAAAIAPPVHINNARDLASINIAPAPEPVSPEPKLTLNQSQALPNLGKLDPVAPPPDVKNATSQLSQALPADAQPVPPPLDTRSVANSRMASKLPEAQPVEPPPDLSEGGAEQASGALISLNLNPIAGAPKELDGIRRGAFAGKPEAVENAPGIPQRQAGGNGPGGDSPVATKEELGIMAAAVPRAVLGGGSAPTQSLAAPLGSTRGSSLLAMARPRITLPPPKVVTVTEAPDALDESVFHGRKYYTMALDRPNLTSMGGSWIFRFAERAPTSKGGDVTAPIPLREVDAAYPADLIRENIHGVVILYAVIRADGTVAQVKVLEGFDDRLDENARRALSAWHFAPGTRDGNPVDLEAVVRVPFRTKRAY